MYFLTNLTGHVFFFLTHVPGKRFLLTVSTHKLSAFQTRAGVRLAVKGHMTGQELCILIKGKEKKVNRSRSLNDKEILAK